MSKTTTRQEREFYIRLTIKEHYSKRELERQLDSAVYERTMLSRKNRIQPMGKKYEWISLWV